LAVPFCDHDGLPQRFAVAAADRAPHRARGQLPALDLGPNHGREIPLDPTCSHPVNVRLS